MKFQNITSKIPKPSMPSVPILVGAGTVLVGVPVATMIMASKHVKDFGGNSTPSQRIDYQGNMMFRFIFRDKSGMTYVKVANAINDIPVVGRPIWTYVLHQLAFVPFVYINAKQKGNAFSADFISNM